MLLLTLHPGVQHFYVMENIVQYMEFNFQPCLCDFTI